MGVVQDGLRVSRFLRERARHRARPDDVYISSYPRSGTTWLQLLVHLVRGGELAFNHIAEVVPWFERPLALGRCTAAQYARMTGPRTFKSHLPHAWLPQGARYVYVYRDGRDVAVSYYHFYRSHLGFAGSFDEFYALFLRGTLQYGSWFRHVADWRRRADEPNVCVLSYEALQREPEPALHALASLCRVRLSSQRVRTILDCSSFDAMKRLEDKFDHARAEPASRVASGAFVRSGRVGEHGEILSEAQQRSFERMLRMHGPRRLPELRLSAFLR
jgi:hypothetical protein